MKKTILCLLALWFIPPTLLAQTILTSVPFQNSNLHPGDQISAQYAFGDHLIIFCYENNQLTTGLVQWTYQRQARISTLPIVFKTANTADFEQLADASGLITITNNTNSVLITTCEFAF